MSQPTSTSSEHSVTDPYRVLGVSYRVSQHELRSVARQRKDEEGAAAAAVLIDASARSRDGRARGVYPPAVTIGWRRGLLLGGGVLCVLLTVVLVIGAVLARPVGPETSSDVMAAMLIGAAKTGAGAYFCLRFEALKAEWGEWRLGPVAR